MRCLVKRRRVREAPSASKKLALVDLDEVKGKAWIATSERMEPGGEGPSGLSFSECEDYYRTNTMVFAAINQTAEMVCGTGFHFEGGDDAIRAEVESYAWSISLPSKMLVIAKELLLLGNSFWERIPIKNGQGKVGGVDASGGFTIKWLPPKTMEKSVIRDQFGVIKGYAQRVGRTVVGEKSMTVDGKAVPYTFKPEDVIHFKWNVIGNEKYGMSILEPCSSLIDIERSTQSDRREAIRKHAYPFLIITVQGADHQTYKMLTDKFSSLQAGQNILLATKGQTKINAQPISITGDVGFQDWTQDIVDKLIIGLQCPILNFGRANVRISDASATAMLDSFDRRIRTQQSYLTEVSMDKIITPYIEGKHGETELVDIPRFVWGAVAKTTYDMRNIALLNQSVMRPLPNLAPNQIEYIYSVFGIDLPEPEWPKQPDVPPEKSAGQKVKAKLGIGDKQPPKEETPEK